MTNSSVVSSTNQKPFIYFILWGCMNEFSQEMKSINITSDA